MNTPLTYYGGKQKMLRHLLPIIPPHDAYIEPFAGGAAVFFAKAPARLEVLNDTNLLVWSFYRAAKLYPQPLIRALEATLHSRHEYRCALAVARRPQAHTTLELAAAFFVLTQQGFLGRIGSWGFGKDGRRAPFSRRYRNKLRQLDALCRRLQHVQLECIDGAACIEKYDRPGAFFFVDPPYYNSNCGHYAGYSEADFVRLTETLRRVQGRWMLTCYPNPHVGTLGEVRTFELRKDAMGGVNGGGVMKHECVVTNYSPEAKSLAA